MIPKRDVFKTYNDYSLNFFSFFRIFATIMIGCLYHIRKDISLFDGNPFILFFKSNSTIFIGTFFLMSGVLFFYVYYQKMLANKLTYKQFFIKRIKRFLPAATISTIYVFLLCFICAKCGNSIEADVSFTRLVASLFLLNPYTIATSMPIGFNVALWFFLALFIVHVIACIITYIISKKKNQQNWVWLFTIPIVIGIIGYALFRGALPFVYWNEDIPFSFITFFLGFYLGLFFKQFMTFSNKQKNIIRGVALILLVVSLYFAIDTLVIEYTPEGVPIPSTDLALTFGVVIFPLFFIVLFDVKWINKIFSYSAFSYLVKLSIWVFIVNFPIVYTLKAMGAIPYINSINDWWAFLLIIAVNYGIALICDCCSRLLHKKFNY